jgi:osmotically-inducible protein OsmY
MLNSVQDMLAFGQDMRATLGYALSADITSKIESWLLGMGLVKTKKIKVK